MAELILGFLKSAIDALIVLFLEHRTGWFATWRGNHKKDDLGTFIDLDRAKDMVELRKQASEMTNILLTRRVWERQDDEFNNYCPAMERFLHNPQLSDGVRAVIRELISAAAYVVTNDDPKEEVSRDEQMRSHMRLSSSLASLLEITQKELDNMRQSRQNGSLSSKWRRNR